MSEERADAEDVTPAAQSVSVSHRPPHRPLGRATSAACGKSRPIRNVVVSISLPIFLVAICVGAEAFAQAAGPLGNIRPGIQQRALHTVVFFTSLGMFCIVMLAVGLGGLAIQLWARVTFPNRTEAILKALEGKRWKVFGVGFVNFAFLMALFLGFCNVKWLGGPAVLIGMMLLALIFLGLLAKAERLGAQILTKAGHAPDPVRSILVGWPVLYLVAAIPLLGWAVLLYLTISGIGAVVLSFMGETKTRAQEDRDVAESSPK